MGVLNNDGWQFLGAIITFSFLTMAVLQLVNDLSPVRRVYQRIRLYRWIAGRAAQFERAKGGRALPPANADDALALLISNATGGHSRALFALPTPQLVAQMNAAAQIALENAEPCFPLLAVLSQPGEMNQGAPALAAIAAHLDDLVIVLEGPPPPLGPDISPDAKMRYDEKSKQYLEARNRLVHRIQRNLDSIQIALGYDSTVANQLLAVTVALLLAFLVITNRSDEVSDLLYFVLAMSAGALAPVLSDILTSFRRSTRP